MTSQEHVIFQFTTPLVLAVCAGGFWAIWFNARHFKSAGLWALAYTIGAIGFVVNMVHDTLVPMFAFLRPETADAVMSVAVIGLFVLALWLFTAGIAARYNRRAPLAVMAIATGIVSGLLIWTFVIQPNDALRTVLAGFGCAAVLSVSLSLVPRNATHVDHAIFALTACAVALFAALPLTLPTLYAVPLSHILALGSPLATVLQVAASMAALALAVALFVALGQDIIAEIQHRSETDGLTGARNRLAFEIAARRAIAEAERRSGKLSLIVGDIDHFKSVNDTWGHAQGDVVIRYFARVLEAASRKADVSGRIGGEELCLLLPTASLRAGTRVAERARALFSLGGREAMNGRRTVTASFGVAEWRAGETYEDLFARADAALYSAKNGGRDRVCTGDDARSRRGGEGGRNTPARQAA